MQLKYALILSFLIFSQAGHATLAGGRPNAFSEAQNAFGGVVNPANAVWLANRVDVGVFWVHQKSQLDNCDDNPLFPRGKTSLTYRTQDLFTSDIAFHKHVKLQSKTKEWDTSLTLAVYTLPAYTKLRTKVPFRASGTTPIKVSYKTNVVSGVISLKLSPQHSIGISIDYLSLWHRRNGYQNSDNPLRSVSPGNVTNRGLDHSSGFGLSLGWRWKISKRLDFGAAWSKRSYCGQFRRYRGFEPHHARNYTPHIVGAGFSFRFTKKIAGRLEVLWQNLSGLPGANNNVLPDGSLNLNKRGSHKSPGPGLNDATFINMGMGYQLNSLLSIGAGFSHRIRLRRRSPLIISHSYMIQTIYNTLTLGANLNYQKHNVFVGFSYGFRNRVSGLMPRESRGGKFVGEKQNTSLSMSWGYLY